MLQRHQHWEHQYQSTSTRSTGTSTAQHEMVNSIINDLIKQDLESLDCYATGLLQHIDAMDIGDDDHGEWAADVARIKDSFYETFSLSNKLLSKSASHSTDATIHQDNLTLGSLRRTLQPFKDGLISTRIFQDGQFAAVSAARKAQLEDVCKLEKLVILYNLLLLYILVSNQLITTTIPLSNHIDYYDEVLNSRASFAVYILQNAPMKLFRLAQDVYGDFAHLSVHQETAGTTAAVPVPAWVPQGLQDLYRRLFKFKDVLVHAISENAHKVVVSPSLFLVRNLQRDPPKWSYVSAILGAPFYSVRQDIINKRQSLVHLQRSNASKLGLLLHRLPDLKAYTAGDATQAGIREISDFLDNEMLLDNVSETVDKLVVSFEGGDPAEVDSSYSDFDTSFVKLNRFVDQVLPLCTVEMEQTIAANGKPSRWTRYWILVLAGLVYIPGTAATAISRQAEIRQWIQANLIDAAVGFYRNWIVKPFNQIVATVRHDSSSEIAIMSQKSLSSDLDSLTRMAIDLATDTSSGLSGAQLEALKREISASIQAGDLTSIMLNYEQVLKSPVSNLLKGKLLRSLLIQIQKVKVDGDVAMHGIDKLLKSQELVFTVVAASPSALVVYYILSSANAYWRNGASRFNSSLKPKIASIMSNIERLLILTDLNQYVDYEVQGSILLEAIELRSLGSLVIPKSKRREWIRDCNDLLDKDFTTEMKLKTIARFHRAYRGYL